MSHDRFGPPYRNEDLRAEERFRDEDTNPDLDLVARWIAGELTPDECVACEERLASDPAFRALAAPLLVMRRVYPPRHRTIEPARLVQLEASIERALADVRREESEKTLLAPAERARRLRVVRGMTLQALLIFGLLVALPIILILNRTP